MTPIERKPYKSLKAPALKQTKTNATIKIKS
jgi:hypothetical protein